MKTGGCVREMCHRIPLPLPSPLRFLKLVTKTWPVHALTFQDHRLHGNALHFWWIVQKLWLLMLITLICNSFFCLLPLNLFSGNGINWFENCMAWNRDTTVRLGNRYITLKPYISYKLHFSRISEFPIDFWDSRENFSYSVRSFKDVLHRQAWCARKPWCMCLSLFMWLV